MHTAGQQVIALGCPTMKTGLDPTKGILRPKIKKKQLQPRVSLPYNSPTQLVEDPIITPTGTKAPKALV